MTPASITIGGRTVEVSRPDKVLFPDAGITKADLAGYYATVAGAMLPHLRDRPLAFQRFPDGIGRKGFFQKDVPGHYPEWIERVEIAKQGGSLTQVVVREAPAALVYLADQACITPHPWLSTTGALGRPDRIILDLDPSVEDAALVRAAARAARSAVEEVGLVPFLMTTGSRGFHVVCPIVPEHGFDVTRAFARDLARLIAHRRPDDFTVETRKSRRDGRVFLDYLRNGYAQTSVAPYAVRARPTAGVATPIEWDELAGMAPDAYTITSVPRRLGQKPDPWAAMDEGRRPLDRARRALATLLTSEHV